MEDGSALNMIKNHGSVFVIVILINTVQRYFFYFIEQNISQKNESFRTDPVIHFILYVLLLELFYIPFVLSFVAMVSHTGRQEARSNKQDVIDKNFFIVFLLIIMCKITKNILVTCNITKTLR